MERITYTESIEGILPERLEGFFVGWLHPPSAATLLRLLRNSTHRVLAVEATGTVVGYVTAITDGVLFANVSSVEVLPEYQGQGIGTELVTRMLDKLRDLYAVDLVCDPDLQPFYARCGMQPVAAMILRRYDRQTGTDAEA